MQWPKTCSLQVHYIYGYTVELTVHYLSQYHYYFHKEEFLAGCQYLHVHVQVLFIPVCAIIKDIMKRHQCFSRYSKMRHRMTHVGCWKPCNLEFHVPCHTHLIMTSCLFLSIRFLFFSRLCNDEGYRIAAETLVFLYEIFNKNDACTFTHLLLSPSPSIIPPFCLQSCSPLSHSYLITCTHSLPFPHLLSDTVIWVMVQQLH